MTNQRLMDLVRHQRAERRVLSVVVVLLSAVSLAFLLGAGCGSECAEPSCAEAAAQVCGSAGVESFICPYVEEAGCSVLVHVECGDGTIIGGF